MRHSHKADTLAAYSCLFGLFLHIILSDPLLRSLGFNYTNEEGAFYEKIHPGTVFIFLSLLLLVAGRNPFEKIITIARQCRAFFSLLFIYVIAFVYMSLRSGPAGLAFIIDSHMSAVICAIVLSYAPESACKKAAHVFVAAAVVNALIGTAEAAFNFRVFHFDETWSILYEESFRASAFLGHPLDNAIFTALGLFVMMAMRYAKFVKVLLSAILLLGLLAFGGRSALLFSVVGLCILVANDIRALYAGGKATLLQSFTISVFGLIAPLCFAALAYLAIKNGVGGRIAESFAWDISAQSRWLSLNVFHYMSSEEILFGASSARMVEIMYKMSTVMNLTNIENPWLMMFMHLGLIVFVFWFAATLAFIAALLKNKPLALQLAVLGYFAIASTANSFGHKDAGYALMVGAVVCTSRSVGGARKPLSGLGSYGIRSERAET